MHEHSLYQVLNSWKQVHQIKHHCFIKAIIPLFCYDDEPSVSNGIVCQLPSSHLLIHWVPAKLSNRGIPYGENYCQLQLLFVFIVTDLPFAAGTLFIGRLSCFISWSWCWCSALHTPSGLRVSFPKPCPDPDKLWIPARVWNCNAILSSTYAACGIAWFCLTMSPNSFFGSFLSNLPLVSNWCQVDAFNSALIASAFAIISCCSKIFTDKT